MTQLSGVYRRHEAPRRCKPRSRARPKVRKTSSEKVWRFLTNQILETEFCNVDAGWENVWDARHRLATGRPGLRTDRPYRALRQTAGEEPCPLKPARCTSFGLSSDSGAKSRPDADVVRLNDCCALKHVQEPPSQRCPTYAGSGCGQGHISRSRLQSFSARSSSNRQTNARHPPVGSASSISTLSCFGNIGIETQFGPFIAK